MDYRVFYQTDWVTVKIINNGTHVRETFGTCVPSVLLLLIPFGMKLTSSSDRQRCIVQEVSIAVFKQNILIAGKIHESKRYQFQARLFLYFLEVFIQCQDRGPALFCDDRNIAVSKIDRFPFFLQVIGELAGVHPDMFPFTRHGERLKEFSDDRDVLLGAGALDQFRCNYLRNDDLFPGKQIIHELLQFFRSGPPQIVIQTDVSIRTLSLIVTNLVGGLIELHLAFFLFDPLDLLLF